MGRVSREWLAAHIVPVHNKNLAIANRSRVSCAQIRQGVPRDLEIYLILMTCLFLAPVSTLVGIDLSSTSAKPQTAYVPIS